MRQATLVVLMVMIMASIASADGVLIPVLPQPIPVNWRPYITPKANFNVKYHEVNVEIDDPVALTKIDQVFTNPYNRELEANYIFPIPENAAISRFVAWLNGRKMEAELLDAKQARKIYEDIVRQRKDPALLEYAGRGMYKLRVYPIPARGEVRIQLEYEQALKSDNGTVEYLYPLNTEKYSGANLEKCTVDINIKSFEKIGAVYCPTHTTKSERKGDREFSVVYDERNVRPNKDLIVYFTRHNRDFGFHMLSYREPGDNTGYFLGILAPPLENDKPEISKNIIFILDSSGSMRGEKFEQAQAALRFVLRGLNPDDKFNIIDYDDSVIPFKPNLVGASKTNIDGALEFARRVEPEGGTNIYDALAWACDMIPRGDTPTYMLFLTDGRPTVGTTDINRIVENTTSKNENRARLFVFGVGFDVNAHLLDRLSEENNGLPEYVLPEEDIEVKVSRLAAKISRPALTDIVLTFDSAKTSHLYPNPLPDLFYGSEIIVTGRFDGQGSDQAIIKGKIAGKNVTYEFPIKLESGTLTDDFIALLWANRRIGYLTQQMRLHGTSGELIAEVVRLSKKFGIVTEYTSFLVEGDDQYTAEEIISRNDVDYYSTALGSNIRKKSRDQSGKLAVNQSSNLNYQANQSSMSSPNSINIDGVDREFSNVSQVGSQGFFQAGSNWIQGDLEGDKFDIEIKNYSAAYFQVLDQDPNLGRYLGLGNQVRMRIGSQVVQFDDNGKEKLTDEELKLLFPNL
ncbi:MAG: VWA domain-containing protein [candidate division Zixibacteria bacterium]|nr:VWA domain-containing protein [candidate division Zixibacteria bacterium]